MIKVKGNDPKAIMVGDAPAKAIYRGEQLVWARNDNLFDINSPWLLERACVVNDGTLGSSGYPRITFFMPCKPNTTYRFECETIGDRFGVYGTNDWFDEPPVNYNKKADTVYLTKGGGLKSAEITTNATNRFIWWYLALQERPTNIVIKIV